MIVVQNLSVRAGTFALQGLSFAVPTGHYAVLMGKTGAGKTTLLEALCGLKAVASGSIQLYEREVAHLKPAARGIGYVPQDSALFPTMTVRDHLAFALVLRQWEPRNVARRIEELADLLGLQGLLERKPHGLSGGEVQRVALGRALACHPGILVLDEPLNALDEATLEEMYTLLKRIQRETNVTTLHVTHSLTEAQKLADRLFVLHKGVVREVQSSTVSPATFVPDSQPGLYLDINEAQMGLSPIAKLREGGA